MEEIARYPQVSRVTSSLHRLDDVLDWVSGFTSKKYVTEIVRKKHNYNMPFNNEAVESVTQYVNFGCRYIEQAQKGPKELAYLPLYYALLNFVKAYISVGKYAIELDKKENRRHGAVYEHGDFSCLDEDKISIHKAGVIPLFYKTLVDTSLPIAHNQRKLEIRMKRIYPYIRQISAEYRIACGKSSDKLVPFQVIIEECETDFIRLKANWMGGLFVEQVAIPKRLWRLQAFVGMKRINKNSQTLISKKYNKGDNKVWSHIRRNVLYDEDIGIGEPRLVFCPVSNDKVLMPEELPILFAFYHMSNISRYNPKAMNKLMDSQYWPTILTLQNHGLYTFLLLFYRYMMQETVFMH